MCVHASARARSVFVRACAHRCLLFVGVLVQVSARAHGNVRLSALACKRVLVRGHTDGTHARYPCAHTSVGSDCSSMRPSACAPSGTAMRRGRHTAYPCVGQHQAVSPECEYSPLSIAPTDGWALTSRSFSWLCSTRLGTSANSSKSSVPVGANDQRNEACDTSHAAPLGTDEAGLELSLLHPSSRGIPHAVN